MPKSKEFVESDDSSASSSSSESEKKGKKRQKKEIKRDVKEAKKESKKEKIEEATSSKKKKNDDGEIFWELDNDIRVTIRKFKGKKLIDVRQFYEDKKSGEMRPGKKGISLNSQLWEQFMDVVEEVNTTVKEMS